jgi:hypothetical protein
MRHNWLILNKIHNAGRYVLLFNGFSLFFPYRISKSFVLTGCGVHNPVKIQMATPGCKAKCLKVFLLGEN